MLYFSGTPRCVYNILHAVNTANAVCAYSSGELFRYIKMMKINAWESVENRRHNKTSMLKMTRECQWRYERLLKRQHIVHCEWTKHNYKIIVGSFQSIERCWCHISEYSTSIYIFQVNTHFKLSNLKKDTSM